MKLFAKTLLVAGGVMLSGCFSMEVATTRSLKQSALSPDDATPREHVVVSNYGWFLFNWIPLACGNATPGASFPWKFFSNQVTSELLHDRLMSYAAASEADVKDLVYFRDEKVIFNFPGTNFSIPIPYLLCYQEIQFSGVLTKKSSAMKNDSEKKTLDEMNQLLDRLNPEVTK